MKSETVKCRAIFPDVDSSYVLVSFGGNVDKLNFCCYIIVIIYTSKCKTTVNFL